MPYYRRLFSQAGLQPEQIAGRQDLTKIPFSSKADFADLPLQDRLSAAVRPDQLVRRLTSGSSGVVLEVRRTRREDRGLHAFQLRTQMLAGLRPSDRRVYLTDTGAPTLLHRAGLFPMKQVRTNVDPSQALRRIRRLQPDVMVGHPSLVEMLLRSPNKDELAQIRPRLVFTGAEMLSSRARETYESAFRCPVLDFYGAHEVGNIAGQCPTCNLYHTCDDSVIVEVLSDGQPAGPGKEGEVVVTSLRSQAMPIIRYRLGDVVRRPESTPDCAVRFQSVERIQGRALDYIDLQDGRRVNPYTVVERMARIPGVVCFEVTQDDSGAIRVLIEAQPGQQDAAQGAVERACRELFTADQPTEVEVVHEIPLTKTGKRRHIRTNPRNQTA